MRTSDTTLNGELADVLLGGGIAILRTDTLYGIVARADDEEAVNDVYRIKGRDSDKSPIVLVSSIEQLYDLPSSTERDILNSVWPGKTSVILSSRNAPRWIRRDNNSVAYRLPDNEVLRSLIEKTGPLIAPSANLQGKTPAKTIKEAYSYFGDKVTTYVDGGEIASSTPSRLIRVNSNGIVEWLR